MSPSLPLQLQRRQLPGTTKCGQDPKAVMRKAVEQLLQQQAYASSSVAKVTPLTDALVSELLADLPVKWERLGDLALVPPNALVHPAWQAGK